MLSSLSDKKNAERSIDKNYSSKCVILTKIIQKFKYFFIFNFFFQFEFIPDFFRGFLNFIFVAFLILPKMIEDLIGKRSLDPIKIFSS